MEPATTENSTSEGGGSIRFGLFVVSAAILTLQILHMRVLSVQLWYHHAYMVVTMALLGFAASGTLVTLRPALLGKGLRARLAGAATLFGVTTIVSHLLLSQVADEVTEQSVGGDFGALASVYTLLVLPYFFGGLVVTLALSSAQRVHMRYFWNLIGSALGAWVFIAAITPLGGERLMALAAGLGPLAGLCFLAGTGPSKTRRMVCLVVLFFFVLFIKAPEWIGIEIGSGKQKFIQGELIDTRWTPLARLDLFASPTKEDPTEIHIVQDGAAGTIMTRHDQWTQKGLFDPRAMAFVPHIKKARKGQGPKVVAIGIGGGADLRTALDFMAESVVGLEINSQMVQVTGEDYADFNGHLASLDGVRLEVGEGRASLRLMDEKFDVIQISGADTYTAGASGSFVLSESYLYTREALTDFMDHLTEEGTLGIFRAYDEPPRETLRLFAMGLEELRRRGIEQPSRHAVVIRSSWIGGCVWSLTPLSDYALDKYRESESSGDAMRSLLYAPGLPPETNAFTRVADAIDRGTEDSFYAAYPVDVRPVTDDSPFFFNFHHLSDLFAAEDSTFARTFGFHFPVAPRILATLLFQSTLLVLLLVLVPLFLLRRGGLVNTSASRHLAYFSGLGMGFMFLEISTIQKLALFLGHPTYSVTVVLFSFLFFAGMGSRLSGRWAENPGKTLLRLRWLLPAVMLAFLLVLDPLLEAAFSQPLLVRVGIATLVLAPVTFLLGMPFPTGLARLKTLHPPLVPWALGVNGGASVLGSILAVILAMEIGFAAVGALSILLYALAFFAATTGSLKLGGGALESSGD